MNATYHASQDLIHALHKTAPARSLVKLGHGNKESLKTLADIFRKSNPPAVPPRVPVREVDQRKLQEMNQKGTKLKRTPQSNPFTNAEPLRVTIVGESPQGLQPVNKAKQDFFSQSEASI